MDIISNIENIESIGSVGVEVDKFPEETIYNEIIRVHLIYFIVGLIFTMFLILL